MMPLVVEAIYEHGVLRPVRPLALAESQRVEITIQERKEKQELDPDIVKRSYGSMRWTGDPEIARRIAEDPDFDIW